ncbi:MAG TPA: YceH family protein [Candidatus Cybelea sp.]|nr:YceH family protein [Candidatus Cybelea sp.]
MNILLNEVECRVLGALIEKEITTPEYYPLSLNALVNACNQKSNRDPIMHLDEAVVRQALHSLDRQSLVRYVSASDSRVTKYEHRLQEAFNFYRHEIAILCVLLLRGPQTPGELRTRTERMHAFDDLGAVQSSLQHLMKREPSLAKVLPRQPGTKESRYAHLLSGDVEAFEPKSDDETSATTNSADAERIALLEKEVAELRKNAADFEQQIVDLRQQFAQFKKQFE